MADYTITITGDQIASYTSLSATGNNADREVTLSGVTTLGTSPDTYYIFIEQVNPG